MMRAVALYDPRITVLFNSICRTAELFGTASMFDTNFDIANGIVFTVYLCC